jgi:hypothetical protein
MLIRTIFTLLHGNEPGIKKLNKIIGKKQKD